MFRRTTTASADAIKRTREIYEPLGGKFNGSDLIWSMPNGGRVSFSYLRTIEDAMNFQGRNITDAWIDEAGQYPDPAPIDMLFGALRSDKVPVQLTLSGNPGGPGQAWIASRYKLIPLPQSPKVVTRILPDGYIHKMAVIPSRITDNRILLHGDPAYVSRLHLSGSKNLVEAWLHGDWNAVEGAYFDCWSPDMVIKPFPIPAHWTRFRSYDWGTASPFSVGWWAVSDGTVGGYPEGAIIRYREWYGGEGVKGLRLSNQQQARGIIEREAEGEAKKIDYSVADPSIFGDRGGPTIAEDFAAEGIYFTPGQNARLQGWAQMRQRMVGQNDQPMIYTFVTCNDSVRTIPILPHSIREPEDLDTDSEDHAADDWRYACMSRPWVTTEAQAPPKADSYDKLFKKRKGSGSWR